MKYRVMVVLCGLLTISRIAAADTRIDLVDQICAITVDGNLTYEFNCQALLTKSLKQIEQATASTNVPSRDSETVPQDMDITGEQCQVFGDRRKKRMFDYWHGVIETYCWTDGYCNIFFSLECYN